MQHPIKRMIRRNLPLAINSAVNEQRKRCDRAGKKVYARPRRRQAQNCSLAGRVTVLVFRKRDLIGAKIETVLTARHQSRQAVVLPDDVLLLNYVALHAERAFPPLHAATALS